VALPGPALPDDARVRSVEVAAGEFDLAVLYGADVAAATSRDREWTVARLATWDRTYALWLNRSARWTHDPTFRRWVSATIDRDGMVDVLFDGQGRPVGSWMRDDPPDTTSPAVQPFSARARPRLSLVHDDADPQAAAIAARLKADLERYGPIVEIRPRASSEVRLDPERREPSAVLIVHRSSESRFPESDDRLLADDRLVPVVRLHAWSATRRGLRGVRWGPEGVVSLSDAGWKR